MGGFGAESGQIPEKVWELWCRARSGSTGFGKRFQDSRKHWCKAKSSSMVSGEGCGEGREALVQSQSQVRFNRVSEKVPSQVQQASGEGVGGLVRFNREKVPEKGEVCGEVPGRFGAEPGQVQQGSGEGSGEGFQRRSGSFGVEPGQVQHVSGKGSGEGSRIPGSIGGKPSQVQWFPEKVTEKAGRLWCRARARSGSTGFRRRFRRRSGRLWCRVRADSREGLGALV